jgi:hypothetical protein
MGRLNKLSRVSQNRAAVQVARVYHLLAKEAAFAPNLHHMGDFRKAREVENAIQLFA